jgi:cold shock CspA family protein
MTEVEAKVETKVEADGGHNEPSKVIVRGIRGTVKWFSIYNHYGFINRADTGEDVFVHLSGIIQRGRTRFALDADMEVELDVASGLKGEKAIAVTAVGGLPIENTRIIRSNRRGGPRRIKSEEGETADEQNPDDRQLSNENKAEGGKRSKKRFGQRRRRGSSTNEDRDVQAGGDAEKDAAQLVKPVPDQKKDYSKDAPKGDQPKTEGEAKKDSPLEKPVSAPKVDQPKQQEAKQVEKSKTEGEAKKDSPLDKISAPKKETKPKTDADVKKQKPQEAKSGTEGKKDVSSEKPQGPKVDQQKLKPQEEANSKTGKKDALIEQPQGPKTQAEKSKVDQPKLKLQDEAKK